METIPGPDGGRQGWIAVLTLWANNVVWVGITKGLGIMLPTLQDQLATQTWIIGWIASMIVAVSGFTGLLGRQFGAGYIITTSCTLTAIAAIAGSVTTSATQLALVYTLLSGIGLGVSNILCKEAVGRCFTSNYATASGISRTGYSVGLLLFGPLVQLFLNTYGWRGTMLLLGGISSHGVVCGALMVAASRETNYQELSQGDPSSSAHTTNLLSSGNTFWKSIFKNFDLEVLRNGSYWAVAVVSCCRSFTLTMWVVYFVSQAQSNGFSLEEAGTFVTLAGVANLLAKVSQGPITDRGVISSWSLTVIFTTTNSVLFCASSWMTSYWTMMSSACLILIGDGILACQIDVLIKQVLGVDLLAGAFGWMGTKASLLTLALGFFPGWLYDNTGSYTSAFLVVGFVQGLPLIPLLILRYLKHY